jgi:hypothetical protein
MKTVVEFGSAIGVPPPGFKVDAPRAEEGPGKLIPRRLVPNGAIYARQGVRYYAHGDTETFLAVDVQHGRFLSDVDPEMLVEIVGSYTIETKPSQWAAGRRRRQVLCNEVFRTKNGQNSYANLGTMDDGRLAAINLAHPTAHQDFAVSESGDKQVFVTGTYRYVESPAGIRA